MANGDGVSIVQVVDMGNHVQYRPTMLQIPKKTHMLSSESEPRIFADMAPPSFPLMTLSTNRPRASFLRVCGSTDPRFISLFPLAGKTYDARICS